MTTEADIKESLLSFAARRSEGATFCPSEVARALAKQWRPLMPKVREVAAELCEKGSLVCTQKGMPAHPTRAKGAIRLARQPTTRETNA